MGGRAVSKYPDNQPISDVTMALINYFGRTGIKEFRIGYSDPEDGEPVVWYATGAWPDNAHEGAGGMTPDLAVERLAELVIDGGLCTNCLKRTVLLLPADDDMPHYVRGLDACYIRFRGGEFVRGCTPNTNPEGTTTP
jgi:hypothetical protein